jgi:alpha-tubulin suppressor-like RCC1 family protein
MLKQEPFKFVCSGDDHNFAITITGKIYGFGVNKPFSKISKSHKNLMYYELLDQDERYSYASCGSQHSIIVESKFSMPFIWGNP